MSETPHETAGVVRAGPKGVPRHNPTDAEILATCIGQEIRRQIFYRRGCAIDVVTVISEKGTLSSVFEVNDYRGGPYPRLSTLKLALQIARERFA